MLAASGTVCAGATEAFLVGSRGLGSRPGNGGGLHSSFAVLNFRRVIMSVAIICGTPVCISSGAVMPSCKVCQTGCLSSLLAQCNRSLLFHV